MRKLMWFTIGYGISCALGTWLVRGWWLLLWAAVAVALGIAAFRFREHPVVKRGLAVAVGFAVGCLWFFSYEQMVLGPAAALDGQTIATSVRMTISAGKPTTAPPATV